MEEAKRLSEETSQPANVKTETATAGGGQPKTITRLVQLPTHPLPSSALSQTVTRPFLRPIDHSAEEEPLPHKGADAGGSGDVQDSKQGHQT